MASPKIGAKKNICVNQSGFAKKAIYKEGSPKGFPEKRPLQKNTRKKWQFRKKGL